jgi:hypothetical protein
MRLGEEDQHPDHRRLVLDIVCLEPLSDMDGSGREIEEPRWTLQKRPKMDG